MSNAKIVLLLSVGSDMLDHRSPRDQAKIARILSKPETMSHLLSTDRAATLAMINSLSPKRRKPILALVEAAESPGHLGKLASNRKELIAAADEIAALPEGPRRASQRDRRKSRAPFAPE